MYALIEGHRDIIIDSIVAMDHVQEYLWLKAAFGHANAVADHEFQRRFRAFWRMNWARLPENWYNQFFNLLHETRDNPTDDVVIIVNELEEVLQGQRRYKAFSFASKLLHTVNNNLPIYDRKVREFFLLAETHTPEEIAEHFAFLRQEYARVLEQGLLCQSIAAFRARFQLEAPQISDVKIIDSLIWKFVDIMKTTSALNRAIRYD